MATFLVLRRRKDDLRANNLLTTLKIRLDFVISSSNEPAYNKSSLSLERPVKEMGQGHFSVCPIRLSSTPANSMESKLVKEIEDDHKPIPYYDRPHLDVGFAGGCL